MTPVLADASNDQRDGNDAAPESPQADATAVGNIDGASRRSIQVFNADSTPPMCLAEAPLDTDSAPGLQPDCFVTQRYPTSATSFHEVTVATCGAALPSSPCWRLITDPACPESELRLDVDRGGAPSTPGSQVAIYCRRQ